MNYKRIFLFVLDGCGCGEQPDYRQYHKSKSNTLGSLFSGSRKFKLPVLERLGLSQLLRLGRDNSSAVYGKLREVSKGNDTFAGVWEMVGEPFLARFESRNRGFSGEIIKKVESAIEVPVVGNEYISGYKALDKYYHEHVDKRGPIIYFSDDGVILFAGHRNIIGPKRLNMLAKKLGVLLKGTNYARIITRPFTGEPGKFVRMERFRKDFIINASSPKLLNALASKGIPVRVTEHLYRIFGSPPEVSVLGGEKQEVLFDSVNSDQKRIQKGFCMYVFQDTDNFGHKKDAEGFRRSLQFFDSWLGNFLANMKSTDLLFITADHGCNPTLLDVRGHNREYVPLLIFSPYFSGGRKIGIRSSFADLGATIARNFHIDWRLKYGKIIYEVF